MMKTCVVPGCSNLATHHFPHDPELKAKWIQAIGRKNWRPLYDSRVCKEHFLPDDYMQVGDTGYCYNRKNLKKGAIPTVFKVTNNGNVKDPVLVSGPRKRLKSDPVRVSKSPITTKSKTMLVTRSGKYKKTPPVLVSKTEKTVKSQPVLLSKAEKPVKSQPVLLSKTEATMESEPVLTSETDTTDDSQTMLASETVTTIESKPVLAPETEPELVPENEIIESESALASKSGTTSEFVPVVDSEPETAMVSQQLTVAPIEAKNQSEPVLPFRTVPFEESDQLLVSEIERILESDPELASQIEVADPGLVSKIVSPLNTGPVLVPNNKTAKKSEPVLVNETTLPATNCSMFVPKIASSKNLGTVALSKAETPMRLGSVLVHKENITTKSDPVLDSKTETITESKPVPPMKSQSQTDRAPIDKIWPSPIKRKALEVVESNLNQDKKEPNDYERVFPWSKKRTSPKVKPTESLAKPKMNSFHEKSRQDLAASLGIIDHRDVDATNFARNKFKGELKKMYDSENSTDSDDTYSKNRDKRSKDRPARRPKTRISLVKEPPAPSFVMKLFDRSVDLTQFRPDTPLYPICRAWFRNNPKAPTFKNDIKKEWKKKEDRKFSDKDIYAFPDPLPMDEDFIPSPPPPPMVSEDFSIEYDPNAELPSREELLAKHAEQWFAVRRRIKAGMQKCERRYERSLQLIRDMYYNQNN